MMIEKENFVLPLTLSGDRVVVTRREHCHDEDLWRLIDTSRDYLRPWLSWVEATRSLQNVKDVTDRFLENWNGHESFEYVFLDKQNGKLVGAGGVNRIDFRNHLAEFGYYRDKNAGGRGYISEFVNLLEKELFSRGVHRLEIKADTENLPSQNVAKRCGFVLEAEHKSLIFDGEKYKDVFLFTKFAENRG